jgi:hypothetical protein
MTGFTPGPWRLEAVNSDHLHDICAGYPIPGAGYPVLLATVFHDETEDGPITLHQAAVTFEAK